MTSVRPATEADVRAFSEGVEKIPTMYAWVAEHDGELLAIVGYAYAFNKVFAVMNWVVGVPAITLYRLGKYFMSQVHERGIRLLYAIVQGEVAERFVSRFGFRRHQGEVWIWVG